MPTGFGDQQIIDNFSKSSFSEFGCGCGQKSNFDWLKTKKQGRNKSK